MLSPWALHSTMLQEMHLGPLKFLQNYGTQVAFTLLLSISIVFLVCEEDLLRLPL